MRLSNKNSASAGLASNSHGLLRPLVLLLIISTWVQPYRAVYAKGGIDRVLSETDLITGAITTAVEHDAIRHAMLVGDGAAIAFELTIPAGTVGAGQTVMELAARPDFPKSVVFAALYRQEGAVEAPRGSSVIDAGTTVLLVAQRDEVRHAINALTAPARGVGTPGRGSAPR